MAQYRIVFKSDCGSEWSSGYLAHFGIKGMKWGIRRWQNPDGTLTEAGKKHYGVAAKEFKEKATADAAEMKKTGSGQAKTTTKNNSASESMKKAVSNLPKGTTEQERKMLEKATNGGDLSEKEYKALLKMGTDHHEKAFKLRDELAKTTDPQKKAQLQKQLEEEGRAADYGYREAAGLARMNKYAKEIASEMDSKYVDPSYRTFNSKEEKARAEEKYLDDIWYSTSYNELSEAGQKKLEREWQHLTDRVSFLSMDGYNGIPISDRNKAMFDYSKSDYSYNVTSDYNDFKPKYEKSPEYQALQQKRQKIADDTGYTKAKDAVYNQKVSDMLSQDERRKLQTEAWAAYIKAGRKYEDRVKKSGIEDAEWKIESQFNKQICKNVLLDLGYEVTPKNLQLIEGIIWYD